MPAYSPGKKSSLALVTEAPFDYCWCWRSRWRWPQEGGLSSSIGEGETTAFALAFTFELTLAIGDIGRLPEFLLHFCLLVTDLVDWLTIWILGQGPVVDWH